MYKEGLYINIKTSLKDGGHMNKVLNNKFAVTAGLIALAGLVAITGQVAFAESASKQAHKSFADRLATKFNLDSKEVQQFFDENKQDNDTKREERVKNRLNQAVKDGKLTSDQEKLLLDKYQELKTFRASLKGKSSDERKTAIANKKAETAKWLKDKGIPDEYAKILHLGGQKGSKNHQKSDAGTNQKS